MQPQAHSCGAPSSAPITLINGGKQLLSVGPECPRKKLLFGRSRRRESSFQDRQATSRYPGRQGEAKLSDLALDSAPSQRRKRHPESSVNKLHLRMGEPTPCRQCHNSRFLAPLVNSHHGARRDLKDMCNDLARDLARCELTSCKLAPRQLRCGELPHNASAAYSQQDVAAFSGHDIQLPKEHGAISGPLAELTSCRADGRRRLYTVRHYVSTQFLCSAERSAIGLANPFGFPRSEPMGASSHTAGDENPALPATSDGVDPFAIRELDGPQGQQVIAPHAGEARSEVISETPQESVL